MGQAIRCSIFVAAALSGMWGCAGGHDAAPAYESLRDTQAELASPRLPSPIVTESPCHIEIDSPPLLVAFHLARDVQVPYSSNPPSSGPHFPEWLAYKDYDAPIDPRYYVHDLEHGAVAVLYRCDDPDAGAACSDVRARVRSVVAALPIEPRCEASDGVARRLLSAPQGHLPAPITAAAWGWTYTADCFDPDSLGRFILDHTGHGPENICADGEDIQPQR